MTLLPHFCTVVKILAWLSFYCHILCCIKRSVHVPEFLQHVKGVGKIYLESRFSIFIWYQDGYVEYFAAHWIIIIHSYLWPLLPVSYCIRCCWSWNFSWQLLMFIRLRDWKIKYVFWMKRSYIMMKSIHGSRRRTLKWLTGKKFFLVSFCDEEYDDIMDVGGSFSSVRIEVLCINYQNLKNKHELI
jgi:hypothetical protein